MVGQEQKKGRGRGREVRGDEGREGGGGRPQILWPRNALVDNIKTWTGLPVEESIRMTEDRDK